jgi:subtilisin family serine protease
VALFALRTAYHRLLARLLTPLLALGCLSKPIQVVGAEREKSHYRPDRIILMPKPEVAAGLDKIKKQSRGRTLKSYRALGGLEVVQLAEDETVEQALKRYRASGLVEFAEPDYKLHATVTPNDPHFLSGLQWSLRNSGTGRDIHAPEAWDVSSSASNIVVAVIDTGIRYTHEDLAANMWRNPNEIPNNGLDDDRNGYVDDVHGIDTITTSGDPMDDGDHGTHVAGIIGAVGNNSKGIAGVAWKVKLMACKFLDFNGDGDTSDAIESIDYARRMGAHILNGSFGGSDYSSALFTAIQNARNAGMIFVAAAGNESSNIDQIPLYPACYALDNIVVVGGTSRSDALDLGYSNYGASSVDLCAPGTGIYSTWGSSDNSYMSSSGTSMATPHVSGAIALMRARFTNLTHVQIISRLLASVDALPGLAGKCKSGGRLNLAKALGPDPSANFGASVWSGEPPLQVAFTNLSLGELKNVAWDFGDGSAKETNANPVHTFVRTGDFKVRLTVVGTNSKTNSIEQTVRVTANYRFTAEPYTWIEPAGMTRILLSDNAVSAPITLPFTFRFYGVEKNTIFVGANGIVGFSADGLTTTENIAMPNGSTPNDMIAPYWDNLDPGAGGNMYWGTVGTAPNRRFVVSWVGVPRVTTATTLLSFQVVLDENTGDIIFQYKDVAGTRGAGRGATVGVENANGDTGALYLHNGAPSLLEARTAVRVSRSAFRYLLLDRSSLWFDATIGNTTNSQKIVSLENTGNLGLDWNVTSGSSWLAVSNPSGVLPGGQTAQVNVVLDPSTAVLAPGSYETTLTFSNLTDGSGNITIPVTIRIAPTEAGVLEFTAAPGNLFTGGLGGPFTPESIPVELRNSGTGSLDWNSSVDNTWVEASPASGTLAAGESITVWIRLGSTAATLPAGEQAANVRFLNASVAGSTEFTQPVRLQVNSRLEHSSISIQDGRFQAELSAPVAGTYTVEYSTDLQSWQPLASVLAVNGSVSFDDAVEPEGKRFYRLRLE